MPSHDERRKNNNTINYMKLENQVTSLEISKKLKTLGVKQESYFYWEKSYSVSTYDIGKPTERSEFEVGDYKIIADPKPRYGTSPVLSFPLERAKILSSRYSAFTVAELGTLLPFEVEKHRLAFSKGEKLFVAGYWINTGGMPVAGQKLHSCTDENEANCRGKMLIYLLEQGLINSK